MLFYDRLNPKMTDDKTQIRLSHQERPNNLRENRELKFSIISDQNFTKLFLKFKINNDSITIKIRKKIQEYNDTYLASVRNF